MQRLDGTAHDIRNSQTTAFELEKISAPTLVVHGTVDKIVPYETHAPEFEARIPNAELLTIENGEHVAIFTHRNVVQSRVAEFLR